jgi:hypothetical protein
LNTLLSLAAAVVAVNIMAAVAALAVSKRVHLCLSQLVHLTQ